MGHHDPGRDARPGDHRGDGRGVDLPGLRTGEQRRPLRPDRLPPRPRSWSSSTAGRGTGTPTTRSARRPGHRRPATALGLDQGRTNALPDGNLDRDLAWSVERDAAAGLPAGRAVGSLMISGDQDGWVSASDVRTGEQVWQVRLEPPVLVAPAVSGAGVVVSGGNKRLWSLSLEDGHAQWMHDLADVVTQTPAVASDAVVVATDDSIVAALDPVDGSEKWSASLGGRLTGPPALDAGHVYLTDTSGEITALDVDDGDVAWSRAVAESTLGAPAVADGKVVTQDEQGVVFAFRGRRRRPRLAVAVARQPLRRPGCVRRHRRRAGRHARPLRSRSRRRPQDLGDPGRHHLRGTRRGRP